jgi:uncharacterized protein
MPDEVLEAYIQQHIQACSDPVITFSWHGGEPTLLGLDYYRKIRKYQRKFKPANQSIANGLQTNGILLDETWARFFKEEKFVVGLSLDGPQKVHDRYRQSRNGNSTHAKVLQVYYLLRTYDVYVDILCVVTDYSALHPLEIYNFFKQLKAPFLTFLPLVEPDPQNPASVTARSVAPDAWGAFLCTIFDQWKHNDIETLNTNIFQETSRLAFGNEQALCIFRKTCGDIPVVEHNGDYYPCDHFASPEHKFGNILKTPLVDLLESEQQRAFGNAKQATLPGYCLKCDVVEMCNGGCPKDRLISTPDGEAGLNYLCRGYKRFFRHFRPFMQSLAAAWQQQSVVPAAAPKTGRNAPCPCGSGKKYKKCCLS